MKKKVFLMQNLHYIIFFNDISHHFLLINDQYWHVFATLLGWLDSQVVQPMIYGKLEKPKTCKYWHSKPFIIMHLIRSDPKCLRYCFKLPWCLPSEPDLQNIKCCVQWLYMMKAVYTIRWQQYKFTKESETSSAICQSNKCL